MTEYISVSKGRSLFRFFDKYWIEETNVNNVNDRAVHRLCSLMRKQKVQTAIVEQLNANNKYVANEKKALDRYFGKKLKTKIFRITFSDQRINNDQSLSNSMVRNSFLGNTIILNFFIPREIEVPDVEVTSITKGKWHSYIYHAAVSVPFHNRSKYKRNYLLNNYVHTARTIDAEFKMNSGNSFKYSFHGSHFFQKSVYTSVCSQAALCMTINNSGLLDGELVTPEDINQRAGIDHINKKFGAADPGKKAGFNKDDIQEILEGYGFEIASMDFFENPNIDYVEYLYPYMESNCPTMLIFDAGSDLHIVPILGHTLNTDTWRPEAELAYKTNSSPDQKNPFNSASTAAWVDHLIIHDDNFGMYQCMPVEALKRITLPKRDSSFRAHHGIAIIPRKLEMSAKLCEDSSCWHIYRLIAGLRESGYKLNYWLEKIYQSIIGNWNSPFITRTLLVKKKYYARFIKNEKDFSGKRYSKAEQEQILKELPNDFWLTEISLPDLYTANKSKIVDVFWSCDKAPIEEKFNAQEKEIRYKNIIQTRLADWLITLEEGAFKSVNKLKVDSHFPLFCYKHLCEPDTW